MSPHATSHLQKFGCSYRFYTTHHFRYKNLHNSIYSVLPSPFSIKRHPPFSFNDAFPKKRISDGGGSPSLFLCQIHLRDRFFRLRFALAASLPSIQAIHLYNCCFLFFGLSYSFACPLSATHRFITVLTSSCIPIHTQLVCSSAYSLLYTFYFMWGSMMRLVCCFFKNFIL